MRTSIQTWTSILAAAATVALAGSAVAQPRHNDQRDDHNRHEPMPPPGHPGAAMAPPARGVAVAPPADPRVAERLHQFQEQREHQRRLEVKDQKAWNAGRMARQEQHRNELASTWGNSVSSPEAETELKAHGNRMARLDRILDIANQKGDNALAARCQKDIQAEIDRDAREMERFRMKEGNR